MAAIAAQPAPVKLPQLLINFFSRYPPRLYGVHFTGQKILSKEEKIVIEGNKKTGARPTVKSSISTPAPITPVTPSIQDSIDTISTPSETQSQPTPIIATSTNQPPTATPLLDPETSLPIFEPSDQPPNPFLPYKNPATGRWRGPVVSLRRQADLFKLARKHGIEELLPASRKASAFKEQRLLQRGLAVKGTGEGQRVKGHKWERELEGTLQKRIDAMEKMPELIREWKMRGNGKGWKKYPK